MYVYLCQTHMFMYEVDGYKKKVDVISHTLFWPHAYTHREKLYLQFDNFDLICSFSFLFYILSKENVKRINNLNFFVFLKENYGSVHFSLLQKSKNRRVKSIWKFSKFIDDLSMSVSINTQFHMWSCVYALETPQFFQIKLRIKCNTVRMLSHNAKWIDALASLNFNRK